MDHMINKDELIYKMEAIIEYLKIMMDIIIYVHVMVIQIHIL